ncbi:hypothetical protein AB3Y40_06910 [Yoonia sp. R2331]|uniref:hypothetical protein n=1 Tax=Yoonia sp. R2331 TaxID=3237238 RepID=UPI0034E5F1C5
MRFSKKIAYVAVFVGLMGVFRDKPVLELSAFIMLSSACICRSIEDHTGEAGDG